MLPKPEKKSNLPDKNLWFFSIFLLKLKLSKAKAKRWNKIIDTPVILCFSGSCLKTNISFNRRIFKYEKSRDYH